MNETGESRATEWIRLRAESEVPIFIDAAVELHRPIFERLLPEDRPHFFDYWLRLLNASNAYLARRDELPRALVTQPRGGDLHRYRWGSATLGGAEALHGHLELPDEIDEERAFLVPVVEGERPPTAVHGEKPCVEVQQGYVRSLLDLESDPGSDRAWTIRPVAREDLEETIDLLRRSYATTSEPDPDLHVQEEELRQTIEDQAGWCWVASRGGDRRLCGVVSYVVMHIPLAGVPGALVSDLAVDPAQRNQGLARLLQRHAYTHLRKAGQRWVFGNILPGNRASRRQAAALGRTVWYRSVRLGDPEDARSVQGR